jgi:hypothetical protein
LMRRSTMRALSPAPRLASRFTTHQYRGSRFRRVCCDQRFAGGRQSLNSRCRWFDFMPPDCRPLFFRQCDVKRKVLIHESLDPWFGWA